MVLAVARMLRWSSGVPRLFVGVEQGGAAVMLACLGCQVVGGID